MFAIKNARILTVTNGIMENGSVLMNEGKIIAVGETVTIPEEAEILNAEGKWVMPGLIDLQSVPSIENIPSWERALNREFGFTKVGVIPEETRDLVLVKPSDCIVNEPELWKLQFDKLVKMEQQGIDFCLVRDKGAGPRLHLSMVGIAVERGVPFDAALRALTINPAKLLGLENEIGSIEVGKCAELTVFDGNPFLNTSLCEMSIVSGVIDKN